MLTIPRRLWGSYGPRGAWRKRIACLAILLAAALGPAAAAAAPRIVAIGDSLTAGYGLPQGEGFVPQLDAWLAAQGQPEAEVVNMGVSGDTTAGGRARLEWALADGADAVIIALGGNDLLRGIEPAASRANLDAMLSALDARGLPVLLVGMQAPLNYGPDYKAEFDAIFHDLAATHGAILHPFFLEGLVGQPGLLQDDGLHPNAAGVARMVEAIGPRVLELIGRAAP
ncbi:arylesterase [Limibaculum sp. FT325]|uniref:arylesterase n=1 Tax=Thermohalobaculum sediminis TaxID=2939436 RepID=UPI0020C059FB|nr:arylesterase [Limibaculum sediminis]MCL5775775.1 arylesterase [Limibaculum sediminis]